MKTESCVPGDPVWTNGIEILSSNECLPVIGSCQVSSILSTLDNQDKTVVNNTDISQIMDIIIPQNSGFKLSNVELNSPQANNYMILKDNKIEQKHNGYNKSVSNTKDKTSNLEDLLYFVCNLCPFLCTSNEKISEHLQNAHSTKNVRKQQQLKCPACQNIFYHKISLRSHLIHDHGVSNSDITQIIQAVVYYAKVKTIKVNEKRKEKIRLKENMKTEKLSLKSDSGTDEGIIGNLIKVNCTNAEELKCSINNSSDKGSFKSNCGLPQINVNLSRSEHNIEHRLKQPQPSNNLVANTLDNRNVYLCLFPLCRVKMHDISKLQYHIGCHTDTGFKCLECSQEFSFWNSLAGHLWRSHNIDMELYCCSECDYRTFSLAKLNNTHKLIHTNVKNFICTICQKGFKNNKQLRNHRARHKEKSQKLIHKCEVCSRQFSDRRQVKLHIDRVHKKLKPFLCNFCGYKSSSRNSLKIHIRQHTGEKPFSCDDCSYTTSDHNSLRRHKLRHTGDKPYKCAYCAYACIQSSTYKMHLKTKHPGQENDMFTCHECQFRSVNKDMYLTHMVNIHKQKSV